jgi:hypothetical protein
MSYTPDPAPLTPEELPDYIERELIKLSDSLKSLNVDQLNLKVLHAEPDKPREGDLVRADGTDWNPGSGEGVYEYTSGGAWSKL